MEFLLTHPVYNTHRSIRTHKQHYVHSFVFGICTIFSYHFVSFFDLWPTAWKSKHPITVNLVLAFPEDVNIIALM